MIPPPPRQSHEEEPLYRFLRQRNWEAVLGHVSNKPSSLAPSEAALRGDGIATILVLSLRMGAPIQVVQAIVQADRRQLLVCHRYSGSVIHEAIRYLATEEVCYFLLSQVVLEQSANQRPQFLSNPKVLPFDLRHEQVQEALVVQAPDILQVQDDLGRNILHHLVEQIQRRRSMGHSPQNTFDLFRRIIEAQPNNSLIFAEDTDGNTPLILLLSQHTTEPNSSLEHEIFQMVHYLTTNHPKTVAHTRRTRITGRLQATNTIPYSPIHREPLASPLYFAILYRRSENTVRSLIQAHEKNGDPGCAAIVTRYCEYCLHVAVTLRASVGVLKALVEAFPGAVQEPDMYGLRPFDWLWMTYVVDWPGNGQNTRRLSRRRHLGREFRDWHEVVTDRIPFEPDRYDAVDEAVVEHKNTEFLSRLRVMLSLPHEESGLLPALCGLENLPLGVLKIVLAHDPKAMVDIAQPDTMGRCPLHHFASTPRCYSVGVPLGVSSRVQVLNETKSSSAVRELVDRYPTACTLRDLFGQTALHIALDAAKSDRESGDKGFDEDYADGIVEVLLSSYPEGNAEHDGKSGLLPFQQAAVGPGSKLDTIYYLLRREPALLQ